VRPLERTFPFWSIGANLTAAVFLEALAIEANITFPLTVIYGKECITQEALGANF
jgi:hypothetical protein